MPSKNIVYCPLITHSVPMKTGRGNIDKEAIQKTKDFLRMNHPRTIRASELALHIGKPRDRAARLLDNLSGNCTENANTVTDFLVYIDDYTTPISYGIFKDVERGIYAC